MQKLQKIAKKILKLKKKKLLAGDDANGEEERTGAANAAAAVGAGGSVVQLGRILGPDPRAGTPLSRTGADAARIPARTGRHAQRQRIPVPTARVHVPSQQSRLGAFHQRRRR